MTHKAGDFAKFMNDAQIVESVLENTESKESTWYLLVLLVLFMSVDPSHIDRRFHLVAAFLNVSLIGAYQGSSMASQQTVRVL